MMAAVGKYDAAKAWLAGELSDGQPHVAGGVFIKGALAGHAEQTLRRAARALSVQQSDACTGFGRMAPKVMIWRMRLRGTVGRDRNASER